MSALYSIQFLSVLRKHYWFGLFSVIFFLCFSLVATNWQASYYFGTLRRNDGIIRGLPMNHTSLTEVVLIWVVYLPEWTDRAGLITASDQTVRALRSCNSWFRYVNMNPSRCSRAESSAFCKTPVISFCPRGQSVRLSLFRPLMVWNKLLKLSKLNG